MEIKFIIYETKEEETVSILSEFIWCIVKSSCTEQMKLRVIWNVHRHQFSRTAAKNEPTGSPGL